MPRRRFRAIVQVSAALASDPQQAAATVPGYCPGFGRACFWPAASRDENSGLMSRLMPRLLLTRSKPRQKIRANVPTYAALTFDPQQAAATVPGYPSDLCRACF